MNEAPNPGVSAVPSGNVLVLGDDMRVFLSIVRAFGRAGKTVHAVRPKNSAPALRSRYVSAVHQLPPYEIEAPGPWLEALGKILFENRIDLVVPCTDVPIILLNRHRESLAGFRLAIPSARCMEELFDKELTHALALRLGVPMTAHRRLAQTDTAESLVASLGLPLVIKPRRSYWPDSFGGWGRVHVCGGMDEVRSVLAGMTRHERFLAEAYFDGKGGGISVLAANGDILQAFQHRRLREGRGTSSSFRISEPVHPAMLTAAAKICAEMNYTGVCMFEFRLNDAGGQWRLLETNARFWGSMALPLALGVDFPNLLYDLEVSGLRHPPQSYRAGIKSRNLLLDGFNLLRAFPYSSPGGLARWAADVGKFALSPLRWLAGREHWDSLVMDDPVPAFAEIVALLLRRRA